MADGTSVVSDRWGTSAGPRALRERSQYASRLRLPAAAGDRRNCSQVSPRAVERDLVDTHIAKRGEDVLVEATTPVRFGLRATPPRPTGGNDLLDDGAQSGRRRTRTRLPRVAARARDAPILERNVTGVGERDKGVTTETEIIALATDDKALNPRTRPGRTNEERS